MTYLGCWRSNGPLAILFGALTLVTGPTVIVPMLRVVRPNATIANILRWEGIVIDPIRCTAGRGGLQLHHRQRRRP